MNATSRTLGRASFIGVITSGSHSSGSVLRDSCSRSSGSSADLDAASCTEA